MSRTRRHNWREAGQGLAEFALLFPLMMLFLFAMVDMGRAVFAYNTVASSAREGARIASVNQTVAADTNAICNENKPIDDVDNPTWSVRACAVKAAGSLGLTPVDVTIAYAVPAGINVTCASDHLHIGCAAAITVTYAFRPITPIVSDLIGAITMTSTSNVQIERVFP